MSTPSDVTAAPAAGAVPVHRPTLHHVNLKTTRLQEMIDWYTTVVGMRANHSFPGGAWLTNDAANHRLALLTSPALSDDPEKLAHTGIHHLAFEYDSLDELLDTYERLAPASVLPHACLDHGMTMSFYYVDPDGNSVELQADNFGAWDQSTQFMQTSPEFAANPIGIAVDPAQLAGARAAGADADEIHRRAYEGDFAPDEELDLRVPLG